MDAILSWGLELVRAFQALKSPWFTELMKAVSLVGNEYFYLAALPLIYWCIDRRRGARVTVVFLASVFLNAWLKELLGQPRPFELDPSLGLALETSRGFPSGHAQGSALLWGMIAGLFPKPWGLVSFLAVTLSVGFSRVYLGVHFPTDVLGGWFLAALFLAADRYLLERWAELLRKGGPRAQALLVAVSALAMNALLPSDSSLSGVFLGGGLGLVLARQGLPFSASGPAGRKALRYLVGIAGAVLLYLLPKYLLPGEASPQYALIRFLRYGLLGFWVAAGAPWLFVSLRLAELAPKAEEAEEAAA
jgi:membrane-associated phospholipid phosphatase